MGERLEGPRLEVALGALDGWTVAADRPAISPLPGSGAVNEIKIPLARATGKFSLSGLIATSARVFGLIAPGSARSTVARTASISTSPITESALISPG